jgi:hypothetical protein
MGFGDFKVIYGTSQEDITKIFKFNSVLGSVSVNEHITDKKIYNYRGNNYYIGEQALHLESSKIIDLLTYENLETYAPLLARYAIDQLSEIPNIIVCGLSIAHLTQSGYFKAAIEKYLIEELKLPIEKVAILPQGVGGKYCYDKYGPDFPSANNDFSDHSNYLMCDIGFNTVDIFQVINNKVSVGLIRGIENAGVIKVVAKLVRYISETYNQNFMLKEGKEILDNGYFKIRGSKYDLSAKINEIKREYLDEIKELMESNFGKVLDKSDKICMFGGGAYIFRSLNDPFIELPNSRAEYYNAVGNYLRGIELANS